MKAIKSLENGRILLKGATRTITGQEERFLNFLRPLMTAGLPLMKYVLIQLAKSVLLPLGVSAGMSAADAAIQRKIYISGTTALIISNQEMEDIIKIVKSLEESGISIKRISETIKNDVEEQKGGFRSMILETLTASILGNALAGRGVIRTGKGTIRAGENFYLMVFIEEIIYLKYRIGHILMSMNQ